MKCVKKFFLQFIIISFLFFGTVPASPLSGNMTQKETVYVPAYSSIYHSDLKWKFNLSITLSIHNIDLKNKIIIESIDYYNTAGKLIYNYIKSDKIILNPLETYNLGIKETDDRGGIGANFIIKWYSQSKANRPIIETIMIGTKGQQGISFTSRGVAIND